MQSRDLDLPPLEVGDKVQFRANGEREWRKAEASIPTASIVPTGR